MNKYYLYNLIDFDVHIDQIQSFLKGIKLNEVKICSIFSVISNERLKSIINKNIDEITSYISIYSICELNLPSFILEKLLTKYKIITDLFIDIEFNKIKLTKKIKDKICQLFTKIGDEFMLKDDKNVKYDNYKSYDYYKNAIIELINDNFCRSMRDILFKLKENNIIITSAELAFITNNLIKEKILYYDTNHYVIKEHDKIAEEQVISIEEYLDSKNNDIKNMFKYIETNNKKRFLEKKGLDRVSYESNINNIISYAPKFEHEKKLYEILSVYDIPYRILDKKYSSVLYHYIKYKYNLNPSLSYIDFIEDEEEYDDKELRTFLSIKKKYLFNHKIKDIYFNNIVLDFYRSNNAKYINEKDFMSFYHFCNRVIPNNLTFMPKTNDKFTRKLSELNYFHKHELGYRYFNYKEVTEDTIEIINGVLKEQNYPISYKNLFDKWKDIFLDYDLNDYFELKIILFNMELNGVTLHENYIKPQTQKIEDFVSTILAENNINSKSRLFAHLLSKYNIKNDYYDNSIYRVINKYFDGSETLIYKSIDPKTEKLIYEFIFNGFCTINGVEFLFKNNNLPYSATNFIHPKILTKFNLLKDGKYLYVNQFSDFEEAFKAYLRNSDKIIHIDGLLKLLGEEAFNYIYKKYSKEKYLLKYTQNYIINFLNEENMKSKNALFKFRDYVIDFMDENKIYNFDTLFNTQEVSSKIKDGIFHYKGQKIALVSLLDTSEQVSIKETRRYLFRKDGKITKEELIKFVIKDKNYIFYSELVEHLESDYGYISTEDLGYIFEKLGLIYKESLDMIFRSIEDFYNKMEEISNEWEN